MSCFSFKIKEKHVSMYKRRTTIMNQQGRKISKCKKRIALKEQEKSFDPKQHICEKCKWSFKRRTDLTKHLIVHSDLKPFKCHLCEKSFKRPSDAKNHLIVHSDTRPYSCSLCSKTFKRLPSLKVHEKTSHFNKLANVHQRKRISLGLSAQESAFTLNLKDDLDACIGPKNESSKLKSCHRRNSSERLKSETHCYIGEVEDPSKLLYSYDENQNIIFDATDRKLKGCDKSYESRKFNPLRIDSCKTVSRGPSEHAKNTEFYKCHQCSLSFKQCRLLKVHLQHFHAGQKHYACGHCNRRFKRSRRLKEHVKSIIEIRQKTLGKLCNGENGRRVKMQTYASECDISSKQTKSGKKNNDYENVHHFEFKTDPFYDDHRIDKTLLKKGSVNLQSKHQMVLERGNLQNHGREESDSFSNKKDLNESKANSDVDLWNFLNEITMFGRNDWRALIDETIGQDNMNEFLKLDLFPDCGAIIE